MRKNFIRKNIKDVEEWIGNNIESGINSADVVKASGYSRSYFLREFSNEKNISVSCYIRFSRLELASKLLTNTNLSVKEISKKLSYPSQSSFCQCFKKHYHISPTEYRYKAFCARGAN
ncbi:AraC family transcriptional regulator [Hafnia sp. HMSC23F03]|uniref:helix-turn-helix domain-containing protein n=1 Tax=Hafnia sp. HMSC23F03 TaxID=1581059 RepID=UPI0009F2C557|nr:AraC family transcriptional regulator [Hafnia sp. HMSC23F03]